MRYHLFSSFDLSINDVAGMGWISIFSLSFTIMSERVNQTKVGLHVGIFNMSIPLPQFVASYKMAEMTGDMSIKSGMFLICCLSLGISSVLWIFVRDITGGFGHTECSK